MKCNSTPDHHSSLSACLPEDSQVGIKPLSGASPDSPSLVIGAQFKAGLITEDYSTPVSDIPVRMSPTPLQTGLTLYRGQW